MEYKVLFIENKKLSDRDENGKSWFEKQFESGGDFEDFEIVNISWSGFSACVVLKKVTE